MIRTLFAFFTTVSLLLLLAVVVFWVRGQWTMDHFWLIHGDDGSEMIKSSEGRLTVRHSRPNGRARITLPRRVSHWACRVGSQLPPKPSRLHWGWRFLTYEGTPAATAGEVRSAHADLRDAAAVREKLKPTDAEWKGAAQFRLLHTFGRNAVAQGSERETELFRARSAELSAHNLLSASWYWEWTFPAWLAAAATGVLPGLWLAGWQRRRRIRREGRCPACGYDLRASRERCPECGLVIDAKTAPGTVHLRSGSH